MKYVVITSQYYTSYHSFVATYNENTFQRKAKDIISDLELHKRNPQLKDQEIEYGDFSDEYYRTDRSRYNVNDCGGDMYFQVANTVNAVVKICLEYNTLNVSDTDIDEKVRNKIYTHHCEREIREIVKRHFELI